MEQHRVLHLMNGFKNASIGQIVKRLIQSADGQSYQWYVGGLSNQGEMHEDYRQLGAVLVDFSAAGTEPQTSIALLRQFLLENPIELIHTHTLRTLLTTWIAMRSLHPPGRGRIVHITTKHTLTGPRDRRWGMIYSPIDHFSLYLPDILVPVSHTMEQKILSQPGIDPRRVITIPNGIPCAAWFRPEKRLEFRGRYGLAPETIVIGFGGRFEQVKRLDLLLQAFAALRPVCPTIHLALAGDGSLLNQLERQALELGISTSITWVGFCQDMPAFLSAIDIFIQTSINEGLPLSVLEAMAAEKPVIATRVGGTGEVIQDGVDGILIPPLSVQSIHDTLYNLITHPAERIQIAGRARQKVGTEYSVERMTSAYQHLYEQVFLENTRSSTLSQSTRMVQ